MHDVLGSSICGRRAGAATLSRRVYRIVRRAQEQAEKLATQPFAGWRGEGNAGRFSPVGLYLNAASTSPAGATIAPLAK